MLFCSSSSTSTTWPRLISPSSCRIQGLMGSVNQRQLKIRLESSSSAFSKSGIGRLHLHSVYRLLFSVRDGPREDSRGWTSIAEIGSRYSKFTSQNPKSLVRSEEHTSE